MDTWQLAQLSWKGNIENFINFSRYVFRLNLLILANRIKKNIYDIYEFKLKHWFLVLTYLLYDFLWLIL